MHQIPSTVSQAAARTFKYLARPYQEFAEALQHPNGPIECLRQHEQVFAEDANMSLIHRALEHWEMRKIANLRETYVAISLQEVAAKVNSSKSDPPSDEEVSRIESLILQMVD
jgi:hypothetical protein